MISSPRPHPPAAPRSADITGCMPKYPPGTQPRITPSHDQMRAAPAPGALPVRSRHIGHQNRRCCSQVRAARDTGTMECDSGAERKPGRAPCCSIHLRCHRHQHGAADEQLQGKHHGAYCARRQVPSQSDVFDFQDLVFARAGRRLHFDHVARRFADSARAIGEPTEILSSLMSASSRPTIW